MQCVPIAPFLTVFCLGAGSGSCTRALRFAPVGLVLSGVCQTTSGHARLVFPSVKTLLYVCSMSLGMCYGARV